MKACAKAEAATDGDTLALLVVTFLRHTPRCMMAAKVGALLPIEEIGPDGQPDTLVQFSLTPLDFI